MFESIVSSILLVATSEMGDKTQLLAFSLAARFKKPWPIMAGILVATVLNHALAATVGQWVGRQFSQETLGIVLAVVFFAFALWTLKPDALDEDEAQPKFGPFIATTILFFLAEMGDKTQLATVALSARFQSAIAVTIGTTVGMLITDGLAVWLGDRLSHRINMKWVRLFAALLFFLFGIASLVTLTLRF